MGFPDNGFYLEIKDEFAVYTNEFKSWEFDKKAAQMERETIAGRQGASEDQKFLAPLTQLKANF